MMDRETVFEPAPPPLARSCSTTELFPPAPATLSHPLVFSDLAIVPQTSFRLPPGCFRPVRAHSEHTRTSVCSFSGTFVLPMALIRLPRLQQWAFGAADRRPPRRGHPPPRASAVPRGRPCSSCASAGSPAFLRRGLSATGL